MTIRLDRAIASADSWRLGPFDPASYSTTAWNFAVPDQTHPVGIDLGTTFSAVAYLDKDGRPQTVRNSDGDLTTPSVVLMEDGEAIVGKQALAEAALEPEAVARFVKREMGKDAFSRTIHGESYPPEVIQSWILKKLKSDAERVLSNIDDVVITVPAYFSEPQRHATVEAGKMAGFRDIQIINEPTAAAIAFGVQNKFLDQQGRWGQPECVLVYDLGGGTFDVTLIRIEGNNYQVLGVDGEFKLGGVDWDRKIADKIASEFEAVHGINPFNDPKGEHRLLCQAEEAKRSLSERESVRIVFDHQGQAVKLQLKREEFEQMTVGLLERTRGNVIDVLQVAKKKWKDLDRILLVGGSTRMPMVTQMLEKESGMAVDRSLSPDEAVAHGAAIFAGLRKLNQDGSSNHHSLNISDVNSHDLGVLARNSDTGRPERSILIPRNTPLPAARQQNFRLAKDGQRRVSATVIEGGDDSGNHSTRIGKCIVDSLPEGLPASTKVIVEFKYQADGQLQVTTSLPDLNLHSEVEITRGTPSKASNAKQTPAKHVPETIDEAKAYPVLADAFKAFESSDLEVAIESATNIAGDETTDHRTKVRAFQLLGDVYLAGEAFEQAMGVFQVALELEPSHEPSKIGFAKAERLLRN